MLLILFWVSFLMFNFSYLFSVLFLVFMILIIMFVYLSSVMYLKYLVVLVYVSGVVVFMLYISCLCWYSNNKFNNFFILFGFLFYYLYDNGLYIKFSDVGEYMWMFLFFSFVFNGLVMNYSLNLFKISGSLRF